MSDIVLSLHRLRVTGGLDKRNEMFGTLAERLGTGLQNRIQQFESARYLKKEFLNNHCVRNSFFLRPFCYSAIYVFHQSDCNLFLLVLVIL